MPRKFDPLPLDEHDAVDHPPAPSWELAAHAPERAPDERRSLTDAPGDEDDAIDLEPPADAFDLDALDDDLYDMEGPDA